MVDMLHIFGLLFGMYALLAFLGCTFYRPTWTDWFEFAVITALFPLSITCEKMVQISLVTVIVLTVWNIYVYIKLKKRSQPCRKALLRLFTVPVLFLAAGALYLWTAAIASC